MIKFSTYYSHYNIQIRNNYHHDAIMHVYIHGGTELGTQASFFFLVFKVEGVGG